MISRRIRDSLHGHTTSPDWLPDGLSPELDALNITRLRLRSQCADELTALDDLRRVFRDEDAEHQAKLHQAALDGNPGEVADARTPYGDRTTQEAAVLERLWAGAEVLGDVCDEIIATVRAQETQLLANLQSELAAVEHRRAEAERLAAEARNVEWRTMKRGQWVLNTSNDGPFGRQPAPRPDETVPAGGVSARLRESALKRSWFTPSPPEPTLPGVVAPDAIHNAAARDAGVESCDCDMPSISDTDGPRGMLMCSDCGLKVVDSDG